MQPLLQDSNNFSVIYPFIDVVQFSEHILKINFFKYSIFPIVSNSLLLVLLYSLPGHVITFPNFSLILL